MPTPRASPAPLTPFNPAASPFIQFASVAEAVGATASRLEKAALLADYFSSLSDRDLRLGARFLSGAVFSLRDQRTTSVGGAALLSTLAAVTGASDDTIRSRLVVMGDIGDVAGELLEGVPALATRQPRFSLQEVAEAFSHLAATSGSQKKHGQLEAILRQASPLEAKYLVKLLMGDLRIGLQEGAVEDSIARWTGNTTARIQWVNMLLGDIGEAAVLARAGRLDEARMRPFHPIKFMLASPAADLDEVAQTMPPEFVVEDKYDGIRAQAHVAPDIPSDEELHGVVVKGVRVAIFSRTLDEITGSYPDLTELLAALSPGPGLILDGEILPVRGDNILPFQELQKRLGRKKLTAEILAAVPVAYVAYDALYADGEVLVERPFSHRREILVRTVPGGGPVRVTPSTIFRQALDLDDEFTAARARGNEGLMVKDPGSAYKPGRRGRSWLKVKRALATLDVVVTAVEVGNGRRRSLLSDYTFAVRTSESDPTLLSVGKAYSGLTDAELGELSEWFRAHTLAEFAHGKVRIVEPKIVVEITFDRVQASRRHKSGFALRFPRILRLRPDKPASEIDTLDSVRKLAGLQQPEAPTASTSNTDGAS